jgi:hypothetical protein
MIRRIWPNASWTLAVCLRVNSTTSTASRRQFRSQGWRVLRLARQTAREQVWRVKAGRVWVSSGAGWSAGTSWLVWAGGDDTAGEKFFVSNASPETPAELLVRAAFRRANVEHAFRVCKSELGFAHFEGRSYPGLVRHLSLGLVARGCVAEHTQRLRGGKPRSRRRSRCAGRWAG